MEIFEKKNFEKFFFSKFFLNIHYHLLSFTVVYHRLLSYSYYRFHYRDSIATLESLPPTHAYVCLPVYYQYNVAKIGLEYYYYGSNVPLFWWSDMRIPGLNSQLLKNGLKKEECNCKSGAELIMVFFFQQLYKNMGLEYFQVQHKKAIFEVLTMKH